MVSNIRRQLTQFATIKSPIDAVKFSNTIQLSPKSRDCKEKKIYDDPSNRRMPNLSYT